MVVVRPLDSAEQRALAQLAPGADGWTRILAIRVANAQTGGMLGAYRVTKDELQFRPRFALQAGLTYRAVFDPSRLAPAGPKKVAAQAELTIPKPATRPATRIVGVYPSGDTLPENLLKFYIYFSGPMSRGEAYRRIRLLGSDGKPIADPFLRLDEELWDRRQQRFTVLFDPGRIKRGLKPREDVGSALAAGKRYTLEIAADWEDADGRPLAKVLRKPFRVTAADETQPATRRWKLKAPKPGRGPLEVVFAEPLDHAMLQRVLTVTDAQGRTVGGKVRVDRGETRWLFQPAAQTPWRSGRYQLVVATTLEDRAGNSLGRPFEVDLLRAPQRPPAALAERLPFTVK